MVEVNVVMGAGMDKLVVDVVEVNVIMGALMHSLVSCFAVNNCGRIHTDAMTVRTMKMLQAKRGGGYNYYYQNPKYPNIACMDP